MNISVATLHSGVIIDSVLCHFQSSCESLHCKQTHNWVIFMTVGYIEKKNQVLIGKASHSAICPGLEEGSYANIWSIDRYKQAKNRSKGHLSE